MRAPRKRNLARLRALAAQGYSRRQIAVMEGVSGNTVRTWCKSAGLKTTGTIPGRPPMMTAHLPRLSELAAEGRSMTEIAAILGVCRQSVARWLRRMEITTGAAAR